MCVYVVPGRSRMSRVTQCWWATNMSLWYQSGHSHGPISLQGHPVNPTWKTKRKYLLLSSYPLFFWEYLTNSLKLNILNFYFEKNNSSYYWAVKFIIQWGEGGNISSYYHFTFALRGNLSQEAWLYGKCSLLLLYFTNLSHRAIRQWSFIPIAHFKQITCIQNAVAGKKRHYNDFNLLIWFFKFIAAILGCSGVYLSSNVNILYNKKLLL